MEVTHARVKYNDYYDIPLVTFVQIRDIKEFQLRLRKDKYDFNKAKYYAVKWTDEKNQDGIYLPAQICQLACGEDEVNTLAKKRAKFTKLSETVLNEFEESDSEESEKDQVEKQKLDAKIEKKIMKKKVKEKEKENEKLILDIRLGTLLSEGLTYMNEPEKHDINEQSSGNHNVKEKDEIHQTDFDNQKTKIDAANKNIEKTNVSTQTMDEVSDDVNKLQAKLINYEKIIDKQLNDIKKLKHDLEKSKQKVDFLEEMNTKILNNINRSSAKRSLFLNTSTPIKQANIQNSLSMAENRSSSVGDGNKEYVEQINFESDEIPGISLIENVNTKQPYVSADSKPSNKRGLSPLAENRSFSVGDENKEYGEQINLESDERPGISLIENVNTKQPYVSADSKPSNKRGLSPPAQETLKKKKSNLFDKVIDQNFEIKRNKSKKKPNEKTKKFKKKESKKKKKQKKDSEDEYDSDQYPTKLPMMTSWYKEEGDQKIKMMHLHFGVSITYEAWKDIRSTPKSSLFLRKLAKAIWGTYNLVNRAIDLSKTFRSLPNRSPRKCLTPVKKAVLRKMFFAFVEKEVAPKYKKNTKNGWKMTLGDYINYLYKAQKKNINSNDDSSTNNDEANSSDSLSSHSRIYESDSD